MSTNESTNNEVKNLDLLLKAAYAVVAKVQEGECGLNMAWWNTFGVEITEVTDEDVANNACGTSACFAGHMPFLGIPELQVCGEDFLGSYLDYKTYIQRIFGICDESRVWKWLFSYNMSNNPEQLVRRVEYFCKHLTTPPSCEWVDYGWLSSLGAIHGYGQEQSMVVSEKV